MPNAQTPRIHPTAVLTPEAQLADDVVVGPFCYVEGPVRLGPGCVLRGHVHLVGPLTLGSNNQVFTGAVLGERPQHLRYGGEPTRVEIGDGNTFREHVTVHRGAVPDGVTRIGHGNFFMANSHIAHDCVVGNQCILANGALVAGHCVLEDHAYLSGNTGVHQFVRIGRLALLAGGAMTGKDVPPFVIQQGYNNVVGVNVVGMRRAGIPNWQIDAVRRAFHILFCEGQVLTNALAQIDQEFGSIETVREMVTFIRQSTRGINAVRDHGRIAAA